MLARGSDIVTRGKFLYHLDVGNEARASEDAFQQIVAEDRIFWNLSFEGGLEAVDFVDALAARRTLFEQILVDVGNRERIGIEPIGARKSALKQGSFATDRQRWRHAGLKHAVAPHHHAGARIEVRLVEGMRHLSNEPLGGPDRQTRVGVKRDDIADSGRQ